MKNMLFLAFFISTNVVNAQTDYREFFNDAITTSRKTQIKDNQLNPTIKSMKSDNINATKQLIGLAKQLNDDEKIRRALYLIGNVAISKTSKELFVEYLTTLYVTPNKSDAARILQDYDVDEYYNTNAINNIRNVVNQSLYFSDMQYLIRRFKLKEYVPILKQRAGIIKEECKMSVYSNKWEYYTTLARLGEREYENYCIKTIKSNLANNNTNYHTTIDDLFSMGTHECLDILLGELQKCEQEEVDCLYIANRLSENLKKFPTMQAFVDMGIDTGYDGWIEWITSQPREKLRLK